MENNHVDETMEPSKEDTAAVNTQEPDTGEYEEMEILVRLTGDDGEEHPYNGEFVSYETDDNGNLSVIVWDKDADIPADFIDEYGPLGKYVPARRAEYASGQWACAVESEDIPWKKRLDVMAIQFIHLQRSEAILEDLAKQFVGDDEDIKHILGKKR